MIAEELQLAARMSGSELPQDARSAPCDGITVDG
jgi:hypothetical protein